MGSATVEFVEADGAYRQSRIAMGIPVANRRGIQGPRAFRYLGNKARLPRVFAVLVVRQDGDVDVFGEVGAWS